MTDILSIISTVIISGLSSFALWPWLGKKILEQGLTKNLKDYQASLDVKIAQAKAELDYDFTKNLKDYQSNLDIKTAKSKSEIEAIVEEYLGDKAAERQYSLDARKRLYSVIGPLRFQLVVACHDFADRIARIGRREQRYKTNLQSYFGKSTVFRLLRILAVAELIERQIAYADFSVDPSTVDLLWFKHEVFRCLSSSTILLNHPKADWDTQTEHIFNDVLSMVASAMIVNNSDNLLSRVMRFDEFNNFVLDEKNIATIQPLPRLMEDFSVSSKPILWIRLTTLGHICSEFVNREGLALGIKSEVYDAPRMLLESEDDFVEENHLKYCEMLENIASGLSKKYINTKYSDPQSLCL